MTKVYVVKAKSGSYDSYHEWIHSIYLTPEQAEESKKKLNSDWEAKRNIPSPFPVDEDGDLIDENISDEHKKEYRKWWRQDFDSKEWGEAEVEIYELGKDKTYR